MTLTWKLTDLVLTLGDAGSIPTASAFSGSGLSYAVSGAGATIGASTGVIPTAAPLAATTVTVTATNSGGSAAVSFKVSVNANKGISTDAELMAALNNAKAGDTITLAAGAVFKEFVWPKNFAGDPNNPLTITSSSRSNQAILRGVCLCRSDLKGNFAHLSNAPAATSVRGVVFEWVTFYAERFRSCKDKDGVTHSLIQADGDGIGWRTCGTNHPSAPFVGFSAEAGMTALNIGDGAQEITIRNCTFNGFANTIRPYDHTANAF